MNDETIWAHSASGRKDRVKAHIMVDGAAVCGGVGLVQDLKPGHGGKVKCGGCLMSIKASDPASIAERFWAKVASKPEGECWLWAGAKCPTGYGKLVVEGKFKYAHHVSVFLATGVFPSFICHRCDVPSCVNPAHLFEGNAIINGQDMAAKGRSHNAKLNPDAVREIRRMKAAGHTHKAIGAMFGVKSVTIGHVVRGRTWKHVTDSAATSGCAS